MKMFSNLNIQVKLFCSIVFVYVLALILGGLGFFILTLASKSILWILLTVVIIIAVSIVVVQLARNVAYNAAKQISDSEKQNNWFKAVVDAIPFPIHVIDNNMNWVFINKNFEALMKEQGITNDRESAYGRACNNAGANICKTENCGIAQLHKGVTQSYFDWCGMNCKQDTSYLTDAKGEKIGYVEIVTDLSSLISVNNYNDKEIKRLVSNLDKMASGNLNVELTVDNADSYTQESHKQFAMVNEYLAKVKNSIGLMVGDVEKLVDSAIDGKLSARADATKHQGDYKRIVDGLNNTLDAVTKPLNIAALQLERMSRGDELSIIDEEEFKGDFKIIINNFNLTRESLYAMIGDSFMLAKAASEGNLSVRADLSKHKGGYRQVIEGMNNTLDSVITPINEVDAVLARMSVNDYTENMSDSYKGDMHKLTESVNRVIERLLSVQTAFVDLSVGDTKMLDKFKIVGRRCENDKLVPAAVATMQSIRDLINESNILANAAVNGDLSVRGNADKFEGGYKEIIVGMNQTMEAIERPLDEISKVLSTMENSDFTITMNGEYKGEYLKIKEATNNTIKAISEVLTDMSEASDQVAGGSKQVSDASQSLSQGASEQASAVEQLSASITEVAAQTRQNAANATEANELANKAKSDADIGAIQMKDMIRSMEEINESSVKVAKVIKVIDDIAFQTNMLALNAAVEAARAGQHGKGFAVVADEVRNLAARSANAVKETSEMIENSLKRAEDGTKIANETKAALDKIVVGVDKAAILVAEIAAASNEQATGITQINRGIEQVAQVVQTNSATSEESAASSEELSGQAELLKQMVRKFKLSNNSERYIPKPVMSPRAEFAQAAAAKSPRKINFNQSDFGKY